MPRPGNRRSRLVRLVDLLAAALVALVGCRVASHSGQPIAAPKQLEAARVEPVGRPRAGTSRAATVREQQTIDGLMQETEALRELHFLRPIRIAVEDSRAMRAYVERTLDEAQLTRARKRYLALGAIDPDLDIRQHLLAVMEEELIGYYDPREKRLVVREDVARGLGSHDGDSSARSLAWRATVVHELVHALQDQHFDLEQAVSQTRSTDADNAFGALVEGDATLVTIAYTSGRVGESLRSLIRDPARVRRMLWRAPDQLTGALHRTSPLLREPLLFRYREGARFCAEQFRVGGWARIDALHKGPPRTTYAIASEGGHHHPHRREPDLPLPHLDWLAAHALKQTDEDVLGALELGLVLMPSRLAAGYVVRHWRGDRFAVVESERAVGSVWWLRFATPGAARRIAAAFERLNDPRRHVARNAARVLVTYGLTAAASAQASAQLHRGTPDYSDVSTQKARDPLHDRGYRLASASHGN